MINEEGGVDPEQFRMDAMYDRMDAIGKSVARPDHSVCAMSQSQVRSIAQEEYYKLFAF